MPTPLDPKQVVSFEELLMSHVVVQQEALIRLFVEKRIFTRKEFLEMLKVGDREMRKKDVNSESETISKFS